MTGWLTLAVAALALWGVWGFLGKAASQALPFHVVYLVGVLGHLSMAVAVLAASGWHVPWQPLGWAAALGAGLCTSVGLLCFYGALAGGKAAVVVPLTSLYPVITVLLSWLFLKEDLTLRHLAGIGLALLAGWLLAD